MSTLLIQFQASRRHIQDVVFRALAKDPKQRQQHFKSVAEYAQAFRRACGLPVPAQQVEAGPSRPVQNRAQDRPPVPAIVSPLRAEAGPSRQVRDQLAEMRLQDTSEHWIFRPEKLTCLRTLTGHTNEVNALVMYSGHLISASDDRTIKAWDPNDGTCLRTLTGHDDWVRSLVMYSGHLISGVMIRQ